MAPHVKLPHPHPLLQHIQIRNKCRDLFDFIQISTVFFSGSYHWFSILCVCSISATLQTRNKQSNWQEEDIVCVFSKFGYFQFGLSRTLSLASFSSRSCCLCILCHYHSHALLLKCHIL